MERNSMNILTRIDKDQFKYQLEWIEIVNWKDKEDIWKSK